MNELETQLAELVKKGIEIAEKTGNFVIDQAPDLLQEFYRWHIASDIMGISFFGIISILFFISYKKAEWSYLDSFLEFFSIALGVATTVTFILACICIYDLVFILTAPKLYLIEYFIK